MVMEGWWCELFERIISTGAGGWELQIERDLEEWKYCGKCMDKLDLCDFYYCKETKTGFCKRCNQKYIRPCRFLKNLHEHHHIIRVVIKPTKNKIPTV